MNSIEFLIEKTINRFRRKPFGFDDEAAPAEMAYNNQVENIDPLGVIDDLTLVVLADTHYHPENSKAANWLKRRGQLYNNVMGRWPVTIADFLAMHSPKPTKHVMITHAGDMGEDTIPKSGLREAIAATQTMLSGVARGFQTRWNQETDVMLLQLLGDHDVDTRKWTDKFKTDQAEWMYDHFGMHDFPAFYLQQIALPNRNTGVLMLDTNLQDPAWVDSVCGSIETKLHNAYPDIQLQDVIASDEAFREYVVGFEREGQIDVARKLKLFRSISRNIEKQKELIGIAQTQLESPIVVGHHPAGVTAAASLMKGEPTLIAGHRHWAVDSHESYNPVYRQFTQDGKQMRYLRLGAATFGARGFELRGYPTAYYVRIGASGQEIHAIRQKMR